MIIYHVFRAASISTEPSLAVRLGAYVAFLRSRRRQPCVARLGASPFNLAFWSGEALARSHTPRGTTNPSHQRGDGLTSLTPAISVPHHLSRASETRTKLNCWSSYRRDLARPAVTTLTVSKNDIKSPVSRRAGKSHHLGGRLTAPQSNVYLIDLLIIAS